MNSKSDDRTAEPTVDFESALGTLVLESFARGAAVEGTWAIASPSTVVPDWRVTIEKTGDAEPPEDETAFLDE